MGWYVKKTPIKAIRYLNDYDAPAVEFLAELGLACERDGDQLLVWENANDPNESAMVVSPGDVLTWDAESGDVYTESYIDFAAIYEPMGGR